MQELLKILDKISADVDFSEDIASNEDKSLKTAEMYFTEHKNFYAHTERHMYYEISEYISVHQPDKLGVLVTNMAGIIDWAKLNVYQNLSEQEITSEQDLKCYFSIIKLYDHIKLESVRYNAYKKNRDLEEEYNKRTEEMKVIFNDTKDVKTKTDHLTQQLISILGIFAGIIVSFSFATTIAGEALATCKGDVTYSAFIICVLGFVFANLLTLLLTFVTKLSGHTIDGVFPKVIYAIVNLLLIVCGICLFVHL